MEIFFGLFWFWRCAARNHRNARTPQAIEKKLTTHHRFGEQVQLMSNKSDMGSTGTLSRWWALALLLYATHGI
jgi:hypothetical protein